MQSGKCKNNIMSKANIAKPKITKPKVVVLTGAGISAESGIKTFRASDGLWENHRIEDVATPEAFARNPELVHEFYNQRRAQLLSSSIQPNKAHQALADYEQQHGNILVVTQNIDNLHERAGSENLIHMHGELLYEFCSACNHRLYTENPVTSEDKCPNCHKAKTLRPDIVWFGEMPYQMDAIYEALHGCEIFISIGTSGNVYPAAGFVQIANQVGARTIELNLEPSQSESAFSEKHYGLASELVPRFLANLD